MGRFRVLRTLGAVLAGRCYERESVGREGAHVPLRGSAALLTGFEPTGRVGFWGVEVEADGARTSPLVVALDLVPDLMPAGLPFALGLVLPYSVGAGATAPSVGFLVRLFVESDREASYARSGRAGAASR